jgi:hypothetical protein
VALIVCGVAMLAAVLVPLQSVYDSQYDESMGRSADRLSFVIDEFWASEADTLTIRGWEVLPSADSYVLIEGHTLTMYTKDLSYRASIKKSMDKVIISHGEEVTIEKP